MGTLTDAEPRTEYGQEDTPGGCWQPMLKVTAGGPGLVAVGESNSNAAVWTSVDGIAWSRGVPDDEATAEAG